MSWKLKWVGKEGVAFVEGWPASEHVEEDEELAAAKVASGLYDAIGPKPKAKAPPPEEPGDGPATESEEE